MSEPQAEYVWDFPPERRRGGRGWLIGALIVLAVAIAVGVFLLVARPWEAAAPAPAPTSSATPSVSPSVSPTASPTPTMTPTPTTTPTPSATAPVPAPIPTASSPAPADPALPVFRNKVQPLLDDAGTGLTYAADSSAQEGVQIVDQLRGDAGRLSDAVAPSSIEKKWADGVQSYGRALDRLREAFDSGAPTAAPLSDARSARNALEDLVGG
ncbi:hypothetical protein [Microbacterium alcoholitolerans]|uniref:hypothetical protein n=1 Tax=unclassified Microbacterium TaxID=2609290 RepID=UPI003D16E53A